MSVGAFVYTVFLAFFVGMLARWAVPGPDPMPAWLTVFVGLTGALFGGGAVAAVTGLDDRRDMFWVLLASVAAAALVVVAYRRWIQKRPLTGPDARRLPTRGFGIAKLRERLRRMGVDPDTFHLSDALRRRTESPVPAPDPRQESMRKLRELRDEGVLTQEEYEEKRAALEEPDS